MLVETRVPGLFFAFFSPSGWTAGRIGVAMKMIFVDFDT